MSNVHELPDSMQRQWRVFERILKARLATEGGCTAAEINLELNTWVQTQISGLLLTIAARDVELFRLRGGGDE